MSARGMGGGTLARTSASEVMIILIREFSTPDEEMKKIVLKAGAPHSPAGRPASAGRVATRIARQ